MNKIKITWLVLVAILSGAVRSYGQDADTNRLTLSARFGFNISAKFKGLSTLPPPINSRTTPRGDAYNYDDGYVLTDISENFGGQSWYWGYDDSVRQVSGNAVVMSRSTLAGGAPPVTVQDDPSYGAELTYNRLLGMHGKMRFGLEAAANYQNLSLHDSHALSATVMRTTYPFAFTPGTTPPTATPDQPGKPGQPYQGSYEGPGFVIDAGAGAPTTTPVAGGAKIVGERKFDADIFGFRLGPSLEWPISERWNIAFSGGLATGLVDGKGSW